MITTDITPTTVHHPDPASIRRAIAKRSFCTLATVSAAGRPHVAGVMYELVDDSLYLTTIRASRKARNVAANPHVAVVIPIRRVPVGGPPSAVQFQTTATVLTVDDSEVTDRRSSGALRTITGHGELDLADACVIRIDLPRRMHTYGLGMSLASLVRHPLDAAGEVEFH